MAQTHMPAKMPVFGQILSVILQMTAFGVLAVCLMRRTQNIHKWTVLPLASWLIIIIYGDSALFVFMTAIVVHGLGINTSAVSCQVGILLCLIFYTSSKVLIYYFLVEKAYVVRGHMTSRFKSKLWLFNCLVMLLPYTALLILSFIFRINYINKNGICIIGIKMQALLPLIIFEVVGNVYLTLLFILPLRGLYSYRHNQNSALSRVAFRSFIGSCATLTTAIINLTVALVLNGEPGYICLSCCNIDVISCALVLHWVSSKDKNRTSTPQHTHESINRSHVLSTNKTRTSNVTTENRREGGSSSMENMVPDNDNRLTHAAPGIFPFDNAVQEPQQSYKLPTSIVTECKSERPFRGTRALHTKLSSGADAKEDEIELHNIRVQTTHTVEVEVDGGGPCRSGSVDTRDGEEWVGAERRIVGEKLV